MLDLEVKLLGFDTHFCLVLVRVLPTLQVFLHDRSKMAGQRRHCTTVLLIHSFLRGFRAGLERLRLFLFGFLYGLLDTAGMDLLAFSQAVAE